MRETPVIDSPAGETRVEPLKPMFVSVKAAGEFLGGIVPREVYRLLDRKELTSVPYGRRRLVVVESLEAFGKKLLKQQPSA